MSKVKEYFEDGSTCPYCGGCVLIMNEPVNEGQGITQDVECDSCDEKWTEVYQLVRTKKIGTNEIIFSEEEASDNCGFCGTTEFLCGCNKRE